MRSAPWVRAIPADSAPPTTASNTRPRGTGHHSGETCAAAALFTGHAKLDGRLSVLYSNKDYGCEWDYDWRNKRFLAEDNTKFAVNIAVYAMT